MPISILKAHPVAVVYAVEILHRGDDRLYIVVRVEDNSERNPCPGLGTLVEEEFERD